MSEKLKIGLITATILSALILLGIIIAAVHTHEEEGLLEVCWEQNIAQYVDGAEVNDGTCERPEKLVWKEEQIPLTVSAITSDSWPLDLSERRGQVLQAAYLDINSQLGFELFTLGKGPSTSSIVIQVGKAVESTKQPLGLSVHGRTKGRLVCYASSNSNVGSSRVEYLVLHHELLHCAGLAHDGRDPNSAVYPFTKDDTNLSKLQSARITDHDRALLNRLYNHGGMRSAEDDTSDYESWTVD